MHRAAMARDPLATLGQTVLGAALAANAQLLFVKTVSTDSNLASLLTVKLNGLWLATLLFQNLASEPPVWLATG